VKLNDLLLIPKPQEAAASKPPPEGCESRSSLDRELAPKRMEGQADDRGNCFLHSNLLYITLSSPLLRSDLASCNHTQNSKLSD